MMLTCTWTDVQNLSTNATIIALTPDSTPVVRNNIAHHHPGTRYIINFCTSRSLTRNVTERNEKFLLYSTNVEFCRLKILTSPRYSEIRKSFHDLLGNQISSGNPKQNKLHTCQNISIPGLRPSRHLNQGPLS